MSKVLEVGNLESLSILQKGCADCQRKGLDRLSIDNVIMQTRVLKLPVKVKVKCTMARMMKLAVIKGEKSHNTGVEKEICSGSDLSNGKLPCIGAHSQKRY